MNALQLRYLGRQDYLSCWQSMRDFTVGRDAHTPDEIWLLEHPSVYTLGMNGDPGHLLQPGQIPLIKTDRGGQVTWHGPGQLIAYVMVDLHRRQAGIRYMVRRLEEAVIASLASLGIHGESRPGAPGVYVAGSKIASVGLRVSRGCSYHGVSLNVDNDLTPFSGINPCGFPNLPVTSLETLGVGVTVAELAPSLASGLIDTLGYRVNDGTNLSQRLMV